MSKKVNLLTAFEEGCQQMKEQYFGQTYKLKGRNPDRRVTLKPPYASVAKKYLFSESVGSRTFYPAEQVEQICIKMDIPVTQAV